MVLQKKTPPFGGGALVFIAGVYKPNFVIHLAIDDSNLSRLFIAEELKRFFL